MPQRLRYMSKAVTLISITPLCAALLVSGGCAHHSFSKAVSPMAQTPIIAQQSITLPVNPGEKETFSMPYSLLHYKPINRREKFPLLVILHGRGDSGENYLKLWQDQASARQWMVLAPNYENPNTDLPAFFALLEEVRKKYPVDEEKVYIAGVSAGAMIAQLLLRERPDVWKAGVLIAAPALNYGDLKAGSDKFPAMLFLHGAEDTQFPIEQIRLSVEELKAKGVHAQLIADPAAGHEHKPEWTPQIFAWLSE